MREKREKGRERREEREDEGKVLEVKLRIPSILTYAQLSTQAKPP